MIQIAILNDRHSRVPSILLLRDTFHTIDGVGESELEGEDTLR